MLAARDRLPIASLILTGWMPSALKKAYYRLKGYKIGSGVKLGIGCVVLGENVSIGRDAEIGFLCIIRGRDISIGERVRFGYLTVLDTFKIAVGEGTRIGSQVTVGGMQSPESKFEMGRNGILMEWSFINTTMPVEIGDDVGIGGHCLFFTHGLWPNTFEGYPASFGPIKIEDRVWLAWRVSVLPGVTIGNGSIISSDACVTKSIPPLALAAGVPAKVLKENGEFLKAHGHSENVTRLQNSLSGLDAWLEFHDFSIERGEGFDRRYIGPSGKAYTLTVGDELPDVEMIRADVLLSLRPLGEKMRQEAEHRNVAWLDIASKQRSVITNDLADEVEEYLRRAGLRFLKFSSWEN